MSSDLESQIALAIKTGTVLFGSKTVLSAAANGRVKAVVVASNYGGVELERLKEVCAFGEIPLIVYGKSSVQLGRISNRNHPVAVMGIRSPGESTILGQVERETAKRRRGR
ncbi:MAG: ribosomal L7Ae/L30e/S12e/Gadd45 family protein [Candidatus Brockarchaeota archaeon]|nr:ribosomal L7Ae/L30e/S12e/Gadd45 family protein [Candidatus Brockarchaeota archaeon]